MIVIEHVVHYARNEKEENEPHNFFNACSMALRYSTGSRGWLSQEEAVSVQKKMRGLLKDLEAYLSNSPNTRPSPSLVLALLEYIDRNPTLVPDVDPLIDLLRPSIGVHGNSLGHHGHSNSLDMHRRNLGLLRHIYSPQRPTVRRQAVNVQTLDQLGLRLSPQTPPGGNTVQPVPEGNTI